MSANVKKSTGTTWKLISEKWHSFRKLHQYNSENVICDFEHANNHCLNIHIACIYVLSAYRNSNSLCLPPTRKNRIHWASISRYLTTTKTQQRKKYNVEKWKYKNVYGNIVGPKSLTCLSFTSNAIKNMSIA